MSTERLIYKTTQAVIAFDDHFLAEITDQIKSVRQKMVALQGDLINLEAAKREILARRRRMGVSISRRTEGD